MANISHDAVLSTAWMLMRRAREAGSPSDESDTSSRHAEGTQSAAEREIETATRQNSQPQMLQAGRDEAHAKDAVRKLIAAYLFTPTHISSQFHSW